MNSILLFNDISSFPNSLGLTVNLCIALGHAIVKNKRAIIHNANPAIIIFKSFLYIFAIIKIALAKEMNVNIANPGLRALISV